MFANFAQLILGRPATPEIGRQAFVKEVRLPAETPLRDPRVLRLIAWAWLFIAVKHIAIIWVVWHYRVPFHQLWINFPTWMLGVLATGIYYGCTRRA